MRHPNRGFHFLLLQIDGVTRAAFHECSLEAEPLTARKLPGLAKYTNIVMKRGITSDPHLSEWSKQALDGKADRKNVSIVLTNETGEEKARWNFRQVWIAKIEGPEFNATGNDMEIEVIELAHEGLDTDDPDVD